MDRKEKIAESKRKSYRKLRDKNKESKKAQNKKWNDLNRKEYQRKYRKIKAIESWINK